MIVNLGSKPKNISKIITERVIMILFLCFMKTDFMLALKYERRKNNLFFLAIYQINLNNSQSHNKIFLLKAYQHKR
jgi:hypothetical protein